MATLKTRNIESSLKPPYSPQTSVLETPNRVVDAVYSEELGKPSKAHSLPSGQSNNCEFGYGSGLAIGKKSGRAKTQPARPLATALLLFKTLKEIYKKKVTMLVTNAHE